MSQVRVAVRCIFMSFLISQWSWCAAVAQTHKDKQGNAVPDVQVLTFQYMDRPQPDSPGEIPPILVKGLVRNNTGDKVIVGILWKIEIKDAKTLKVIEVLHPYTFEDRFNPRITMKIVPHDAVEVPFFVSRTVHTDHTRDTSVEIEDYVYSSFDQARDKTTAIESYIPESWPFKSHTEPVKQEPKKQ